MQQKYPTGTKSKLYSGMIMLPHPIIEDTETIEDLMRWITNIEKYTHKGCHAKLIEAKLDEEVKSGKHKTDVPCYKTPSMVIGKYVFPKITINEQTGVKEFYGWYSQIPTIDFEKIKETALKTFLAIKSNGDCMGQ